MQDLAKIHVVDAEELPHGFCAVLSTDLLKERIEEPLHNALIRICQEITPVCRQLKAREMFEKLT